MSKKGLYYGIAAYSMWGFFPLFWRLLDNIPAIEILVNRIIWSLVFLLLLLAWQKKWAWLQLLRSHHQTVRIIIAAAGLLAVNWFIYIWAVNADFVVETSLGYFINPLVNVLLGTLVLHEHLRPGQWLAIGLAAASVIFLTISYQSLPWIALSLAFSFGLYGLLKKKVRLGAAESLTAEMMVLVIPAIIFSLYLIISEKAIFVESNQATWLLLLCGGAVTAVPLIFFAAAARRIPLSTMGILQYIAPTLQFLIGVFIFNEPFSRQSLFGFCLIWGALVFYSLEGVWYKRNQPIMTIR